MHGVGASPSPRIRDPCHLRALHDAVGCTQHTMLPPDTPMPDVGLLGKSIYNSIALGEKDVSGISLVAVTGHIFNICFEIEIARRKMVILLDRFN